MNSEQDVLDNFKTGVKLNQFASTLPPYDIKKHMFPFLTENSTKDHIVQTKVKAKNHLIKQIHYEQSFKTQHPGDTVYLCNKDQIIAFKNDGFLSNRIFVDSLMDARLSMSFMEFNALETEQSSRYIMKKVKLSNFLDLLFAIREFHLLHEIYSSHWDGKDTIGDKIYHDIYGKDIVAKPYFSGIFWSGNKWSFITVASYIEGKDLKDIKHPESRVIDDVESTVKKLWLLGYAHNDLSEANVRYHKRKHRAYLIDFEMCISIPKTQVDKFRIEVFNKEPDFDTSSIMILEDAFIKHYRNDAMALVNYLALTTQKINQPIWKNRDEMFLTIVGMILTRRM